MPSLKSVAGKDSQVALKIAIDRVRKGLTKLTVLEQIGWKFWNQEKVSNFRTTPT